MAADESVFYLVIDRQRETENVYFLKYHPAPPPMPSTASTSRSIPAPPDFSGSGSGSGSGVGSGSGSGSGSAQGLPVLRLSLLAGHPLRLLLSEPFEKAGREVIFCAS